MFYNALVKGPYKVPGFHDPNSKRIMGILFRPRTWTANTVYYVRSDTDYDILIPTVFKGLYYKTVNPGKTSAVEPTWPTVVGDQVTDGATFEAVAYNLMVPEETITASTWTATDAVTLSGAAFDGVSSQVTIQPLPSGLTTFSITNHFTKSNGEEDDVTLQFKVASR